MSVRFFRWTFVALLLIFWITMFLYGDRTIGASSELSNGNYRFVAGTRPQYLILALLIIAAYIALMHVTIPPSTRPVPGVVRRHVAFLLDFMLAVIAAASAIGLMPVLVEWKRTDRFAWVFERNAPGPSDDLIATVGVSICFALLFLYFLVPLIRRRPSPGACILGYQIIPDDGQSLTVGNATTRIFLGCVAVGLWPLAPFIGRERHRGKMWIDRVCNTRAVEL
jgi:hypothetical protein